MRIIGASVLIILAVLFRTLWHVAPNVEYVTTASFLAAAYLGGAWAVLVPFSIMVLTDTLIGNTSIFIFTWSAYMIIGFLGFLGMKSQNSCSPTDKTNLNTPSANRRSGQNQILNLKILRATGLGITASLFFYLYTNFGVWLLDSWEMYPRTLAGLMECYVMGLPFLKLNLLGNLFFIPVSFGIVEGIKAFYAQKSWPLYLIFRR